MKSKSTDITNHRFNNWTVLRKSEQAGKYTCKCVCGTIRDVTKGNLGRVKGCGCDREYTGKYSKTAGYRPRKPTYKAKNTKPAPSAGVVVKKMSDVIKPRNLTDELAERRANARRKAEDLRNELALARELSL